MNSGSPCNVSTDNRRSKVGERPTTPCCWFQTRPREEAVNDLCGTLSPGSTATARGLGESERDKQSLFNSLSSQITASGILGNEVPNNLSEPPSVLVQKTKTTILRKNPKTKAPETDVLMIRTSPDADPIPVDKLVVEMVKITPVAEYESMIHEVKRKARTVRFCCFWTIVFAYI